MSGIDDILAIAEDPAYRRVVTARVSLIRQELRDEHAELEALLPTLVSDTIDEHPLRHQTAVRLAAIEAEIAASTVEFRFVAVGHKAWADLLRQHPPTRQQLSARRDMDHNPETFPYAAIAASCVDPVMTVDDVRRLEAAPGFDVAAWSQLWDACLRANVADTAPKSLAAGLILRQNGGSATTAAPAAFPAPSSSAVS